MPFLREELNGLAPEDGRAADLRRLVEEADTLPRRLPDPKARMIAQKVLEYGAPIPWKQIVAELGYRWTVGSARYAYARVCRLCFDREDAL
jgi:hypothetical protein